MELIQPLLFILMAFLLVVVFIKKVPRDRKLRKQAWIWGTIVLVITAGVLLAGLLPLFF
ncbi:hypothetical protein [Alteribacter natronophilus]|uniref:hypothetical protein n=1 Tax=Alteribacter natronophilus TaxID=2583810 RepID=UPI001485C93F|nr:hypothetical protein [Alteribacter natronophilus]